MCIRGNHGSRGERPKEDKLHGKELTLQKNRVGQGPGTFVGFRLAATAHVLATAKETKRRGQVIGVSFEQVDYLVPIPLAQDSNTKRKQLVNNVRLVTVLED